MSSPSAKLEVSPSPCFPCAPYRAEPAPPPPPPHFPICDSPFLPLETSDCSHRIRIWVKNFGFPETDGAEKKQDYFFLEGIVFFGPSRKKKSRIRWMASPKETFSQVFINAFSWRSSFAFAQFLLASLGIRTFKKSKRGKLYSLIKTVPSDQKSLFRHPLSSPAFGFRKVRRRRRGRRGTKSCCFPNPHQSLPLSPSPPPPRKGERERAPNCSLPLPFLMAGKDEVWSGWVGHPILFLLLLLFLAGFLKREEEEEDKRKEERGFHDGGSEEGEIEGGKGGTGALEWIQAVLAFPLFLLFLGSIWTKVQVKIEDFPKRKASYTCNSCKDHHRNCQFFPLFFLRTGIQKLLEISILCHLEFPSFPRFRCLNGCSKEKDN